MPLSPQCIVNISISVVVAHCFSCMKHVAMRIFYVCADGNIEFKQRHILRLNFFSANKNHPKHDVSQEKIFTKYIYNIYQNDRLKLVKLPFSLEKLLTVTLRTFCEVGS